MLFPPQKAHLKDAIVSTHLPTIGLRIGITFCSVPFAAVISIQPLDRFASTVPHRTPPESASFHQVGEQTMLGIASSITHEPLKRRTKNAQKTPTTFLFHVGDGSG
jgi:hypothetical protein